MEEPATTESQSPSMHHREIALADGRYMIFYTFDGPAAARPNDTDEPSTAKSNDV